jgi:hypothetical protein
MTNTELILNMLAEASTKDISQATNPKDFEESKKVAKQSGNVAKVALKEIESKTGKEVVSPLNAKAVLENKKIEIKNQKLENEQGITTDRLKILDSSLLPKAFGTE